MSRQLYPRRESAEAAFHLRMVGIYDRALCEVGYKASLFLRMVSEHGGLETARRLLAQPSPSDGFTALWEAGRLDLTMEVLVLEDEFADLFTPLELRTARRRLNDYGFET